MKFFQKYKKTKIILLLLLLPPFLYEGSNMFVDFYNFRQLEKAKPILESIKPDDKKFSGFNNFTEKYDVNIRPIKNCYSITNNNGIYPYLFGFQLESYIYIYIYGSKIYTYPGYDVPIWNFCVSNGCVDGNRKSFEKAISNKCRKREE